MVNRNHIVKRKMSVFRIVRITLGHLSLFNSFVSNNPKHFIFRQLCSELNTFTWRSHTCGELRTHHAGQKVTICGWIHFQRSDKFVILRDSYGTTQIICNQNNSTLSKLLASLPLESVIQVKGTVLKRPDGQVNKKMLTGEVEINAEEVQLLSRCKSKLPFNIRDYQKVKESLRLEYRYLSLRKPEIQNNLRIRSQVVMKMREFLLNKHSFVEVETPSLFKRTPGGAEEFIVPTKFPGRFYSLTQSPQQFKQLLMIGSLDRYFQIARCYRNEGAKIDRQPEFTQVDIEASFTTAKDIKDLVEGLLQYSWPEEKGKLDIPFPSITYADAIRIYGSDKPDTRYGMKLQMLTHYLLGQSIDVIDRTITGPDCIVAAIVIPQGSKYIKKLQIAEFQKMAKLLFSVRNLFEIYVRQNMTWNSFLAKHVKPEVQQEINGELCVSPEDLILIASGNRDDVCHLLGKVRVECAQYLQSMGVELYNPGELSITWIVDFPLFLKKEEGFLESAHHPFTAPHPDDADLLYSDPTETRSQHYDLVINGQEVGGGSIRIHDSQLQKYILENILKEDSTSLEYFLDALDSGCPPHGGIALGLDRLMAIICGSQSIREVMAFPKSLDGKDLMSGAPSPISDKEKLLYHIQPLLEDR